MSQIGLGQKSIIVFGILSGKIFHKRDITKEATFMMYKKWTPYYTLEGKYFGAIIDGEFQSLKTLQEKWG